MQIARVPTPELRPFIKTVWALDGEHAAAAPAARERVLPTGGMHLVFRLTETPLLVFDAVDDPGPRAVGCAIVGGARASFYVRDVSLPVRAVGAQLHPGAAPLLLGVSARELAERHTPLSDLWGREAAAARSRVAEAGSLAEQLAVFEALLAARLPRIRGMHPAVAEGIARLSARDAVGEIVRSTGYSHRRFIQLFHDAVGLTPKAFARVARFQAVLAGAPRRGSWAQLALDAGYSDQAHLCREFTAIAGVSPGRYVRASEAAGASHHVPVEGQIPSRPGTASGS